MSVKYQLTKLNYEQRYKEALKRAKYLKENTDGVGALDVSKCFEEIFPELKESGDDTMRKYVAGWKDSEEYTIKFSNNKTIKQ